jgi:hypothetical protein
MSHHGFEDLLPGRTNTSNGAPAGSAGQRRSPGIHTPGSDVPTPVVGMSGRSVMLVALFVLIVVVIVVLFVRRVRARRQEVVEPEVEPDLPPLVNGEHALGGVASDEQQRQEAYAQAQARAHMQRLQQQQQHHQHQAHMEQQRQQQMAAAAPAPEPDNMFQPLSTHPIRTD